MIKDTQTHAHTVNQPTMFSTSYRTRTLIHIYNIKQPTRTRKRKIYIFWWRKTYENKRKRDKNTTCKTGIICDSKNMRAQEKNTTFSLTRSFAHSRSLSFSSSLSLLICECFNSILSHICATIFSFSFHLSLREEKKNNNFHVPRVNT